MRRSYRIARRAASEQAGDQARRRVEAGGFYGSITSASVIARKPA
jgi:hypothetical protein